MKPDAVNVASYPDLDDLLKSQVSKLGDLRLQKEVWLDDESELKPLAMDSVSWKKELSFLEEINPNQPEYVGAFVKVIENGQTQLKLREGEKGSLKSLIYKKSEGSIIYIQATIHEDKDVYVHHQEIEVNFSGGLTTSYSIDGYQKIMMKDTIKFKIKGKIPD